MRTRDIGLTISMITLAGLAQAGPVQGTTGTGDATRTEQTNEYIDLIVLEDSVQSITPDETVSIALNAWNLSAGQIGTYNDQGAVSIPIGVPHDPLSPVPIGVSPNGVTLMAHAVESEAPGDFMRRIQVSIATADGSALLPFGTQLNQQQVQLLSWEIGVGDDIQFGNWLGEVTLSSATMFGSFDGGNSFAFQQNLIQLFQQGLSQWDITGAFDTGTPVISDTSGGAGFNAILLDYTYRAIPAPATIVLLAGAGVGLTRRRRT